MPAPTDSFLATLASRMAGAPLGPSPSSKPQGYLDLVQGEQAGGTDFMGEIASLMDLIPNSTGGKGGSGWMPGGGNIITGPQGIQGSAGAIKSLRMAQRQLGLPIFGNIVSDYRTRAEQQRLYNLYKAGKGNLAAPPGESLHELGLAFDISTSFLQRNPELKRWLTNHGWHNSVEGEPWHWSYRRAG